MAEKSIGALPVIADGLVIGILSERDYARNVALLSRSSKDTQGEIIQHLQEYISGRPSASYGSI